MAKFVQNGSNFFLAGNYTNEVEELPVGTYLVEYSQVQGYYFSRTEDYRNPSKLYGDINNRAERIINTFHSRADKNKANTGILLSGNKGSGKTQLAKVMSTILREQNVCTFIIQSPYTDPGFLDFIKNSTQKALVVFDEFEKVYSEQSQQEALLSLLDGTNAESKLFVLTSNRRNVSQYFLNRPTRIFYHFEYGKLEKSFMIDLLEDTLNDKRHVHNFETLLDASYDISFDVIQGLIEELNRYPESTFVDCLKYMNIEVITQNQNGLEAYMEYDGKPIKLYEKRGYGFHIKDFMDEDSDNSGVYVRFDPSVVMQEEDYKALGVMTYDDEEVYVKDKDGNYPTMEPYDHLCLKVRGSYSDTTVMDNKIFINRKLPNGKTLHLRFTKPEKVDPMTRMFPEHKK